MSDLCIHEYRVTMTSNDCSEAVQRAFRNMLGVDEIEISLPDQKVKVTCCLSAEEILDVIKRNGKDAEYIATYDI